MYVVEIREQQRERLRRTIKWARRIRAELQPLLDAHGANVHFRPSSTGVAMAGLLPDRPQRGKSRITNLKSISDGFHVMFDSHCRNVEQGRVTGEKALQSFLISEAQTNGRRLVSLNRASAATDEPVELWFITDEISLPVEGGKVVCDLLALRRDDGRCTPVVIELKDSRQLTRLVEQVEGYAKLIALHADLFAELYGAVLGERIAFDGPTEKWIVWPTVGTGPDRRTNELLGRGIRMVSYGQRGTNYLFDVGPRALRVSAGEPNDDARGTANEAHWEAIRRTFADYFRNWKLELPPSLGTRSGEITGAGWSVLWRTASLRGRSYLDFHASHRMTNDRHHRVWSDGRMASLPADHEFLAFPPGTTPEGEDEIRRRASRWSGRLSQLLRAKFRSPDDGCAAG